MKGTFNRSDLGHCPVENISLFSSEALFFFDAPIDGLLSSDAFSYLCIDKPLVIAVKSLFSKPDLFPNRRVVFDLCELDRNRVR